jgi:hypothetical protein
MSQAGWYPDPDPASPGRVRWWDGSHWTDAVRYPAAPGYAPYAVPVAPPFNATADLQEEVRTGRRAATALVVGVVAYVFLYIADNALFRSFFDQLRKNIRAASNPNASTQPLTNHFARFEAVTSIADLALLAIGVIFLIWFYQAANVARRIGLPARWASAWAIAGWIVPILNFFVPYQAARDMFPSGHPGRRLVSRWWALWLCTQVGGLVVIAASLASRGAGWVLVAAATGVAAGAAVAGRAVIAEVNQVHADLLGH